MSSPTLSTLMNHTAPHFVADAVLKGQKISIDSDSLKGKWAILVFYDTDFGMVSATELVAFSKSAGSFARQGASVIAISTDAASTHAALTDHRDENAQTLGTLEIPLVADSNRAIAAAYGVLNTQGTADQAMIIIDSKHMIRQITINGNTVGRSVGETLRLLRAYQEHDKKGDVCPAGWDEGKSTMVPTQEGLKSYLKSSLTQK